VVKNVSFEVHEGEIVGIAGVCRQRPVGTSRRLFPAYAVAATRGTLKINGETD
jgi:ABC-type sugar transport system ATPase subunit